MNAVRIIDAIKHLPPCERDEVVGFVRALDTGRPWTAERLSTHAEKLAGTHDPTGARELKERLAAGFCGNERFRDSLTLR